AVQHLAADRRVLDPEIDLDDVVDRTAGRFDAQSDLPEDVGDLRLGLRRHGGGVGIAAADDARHQDVADPAGVGDRVLVLEARIVDALALGHLSSLPVLSASMAYAN